MTGSKPYTLMRGIRERELFKGLVAVQQQMIEICEELHQVSDPKMQAPLREIVTLNKSWQGQCIGFVRENEKMLEKLSESMGDLRRGQ